MELPINHQPPEPPDVRGDGSLDVHSIFYTIQGEGPFAGEPAVFLRLAGCSIRCGGCDTDYTQGRQRRLWEWVYDALLDAAPPHCSLIVVTGGEPFRQNLGPLVRELLTPANAVGGAYRPFRVQVETNGTLPMTAPPHPRLTVVCSPKTAEVDPQCEVQVGHWKYVLAAGDEDPEDGLPLSSLLMRQRPYRPRVLPRSRTWVQPMDEGDSDKNKANLAAAVASCMRRGYRLSVQVHKLVGVP